LKYRAEIDGLRAIAVVPVILFHAGLSTFSGGFVGVDIFFVISGYLITTILIDDIENNQFSVLNFYERRARRILPALFFVMLACIPIAWIWMIPSQMENFSQSLVAVSVFGSNILFWLTSGYFASASEEKPLLHTWSLAVEEQYYLLFPIFLLLFWRYGRNRVVVLIMLLAGISLLISEIGWRTDSSANFYLAPSRAWELFAGSLAAFLVGSRGVKSSNALSTTGFSAIVISIFLYDESTPFPSIYALLPVAGVVLVILYADNKTIIAKLLSARLLVWIGLISYSVYLWHQPLFAYRKILSVDNNPFVTGALIIFSFCLGFLSWRFVERPFRNKAFFSRRMIFSLAAGFTLFFIAFGLIGHFNNGFKDRSWVVPLDIADRLLPDNPQENKECSEYFEIISPVRFCRKTYGLKPSIAIIGDSEGAALFEGLAKKLSESSLGLAMVGGRLFTSIETYPLGSAREKKFSEGGALATNTIAKNNDIETVIVVSRGPFYMDGDWEFYLKEEPTQTDRAIVMEAGLHDVLNLLRKKRNVLFVLDPPKLGINPERCYKRPFVEANPCVNDRNVYLAEHKVYREIVSRVVSSYPNVTIYDPANVLCDDLYCYGAINGKVLYGDPGHLNVAGASLVAETLAPILVGLLSHADTDSNLESNSDR